MQKMPEALGALGDGKIGVGHADALARESGRLSGSKQRQFEEESADLVADAVAEALPVPQFEKRCRETADRIMGDDGIAELEKQRRKSRAWTRTDLETGMLHLYGEFDGVVLGYRGIGALPSSTTWPLRSAGGCRGCRRCRRTKSSRCVA